MQHIAIFQLIVMIFMPDSVELLEIIKFYTAKSNDIWTKNDNNTILIIKHHNSKHYYIHQNLG